MPVCAFVCAFVRPFVRVCPSGTTARFCYKFILYFPLPFCSAARLLLGKPANVLCFFFILSLLHFAALYVNVQTNEHCRLAVRMCEALHM